MEKGNINLEAKLQFRSIELLHSNIFYSKVATHNTVFNFDINSEIQISEENKMLFVIINVKIYDVDKSELLGDIAVSSIFYIDNFEEVILTKKDGSKVIPDNLIIILNSISLSTTRGIMWSTFKGSPLHSAILPIVDSKQFAPQVTQNNRRKYKKQN